GLVKLGKMPTKRLSRKYKMPRNISKERNTFPVSQERMMRIRNFMFSSVGKIIFQLYHERCAAVVGEAAGGRKNRKRQIKISWSAFFSLIIGSCAFGSLALVPLVRFGPWKNRRGMN